MILINNTVNKALPTHLKQKNRQYLIEIIRKKETFTINELVEQTNISRQTVMKSISYFQDKGFIQLAGKGVSTDFGGKRPELYQVNAHHLFFVSICFSYGSIALALLNFKGEIMDQKEVLECDESSLPHLIERIYVLAIQLVEKNQLTMTQIYAMTFCVAGAFDKEKGILHYNVFNPSWGREIKIEDELRKIIHTPTKLLIEHVGKSAALAEIVKDHSLLLKDIIVIYTSIGVSSSHLDHGVLRNGANGIVGEIGHMIVESNDNERCACGSYGCFERMISEERMIDNTKKNSSLLQKSWMNGKEITLQVIFDAANLGDEYARSIVKRAVTYFASVIRNLVLVNDPDTIIIQGIYSNAGAYFEEELNKALASCQFYPKDTKFDIRLSKGELWQLSITGSTHALIRNYLQGKIEENN